MDKTAIVQIQESSNIPALIKQLNANTQAPTVIVPESMRVESLEQYMPNAAFYRLNYQTDSIDDFVEYNKTFEQEGATCFIDAKSMTGKTIFDLGSTNKAGHKKHTASINLNKTAAFKALLSRTEECSLLNQKDAAEFLEDWKDNLSCKNMEGESMKVSQAAQSIRTLTIETSREQSSTIEDFSESRSAMERIEAKNKGDKVALFIFRCDPYHGLAERDFYVRVSILTGGEKPSIRFRIVQLEAQEEDIAQEFKVIIQNAFEDSKINTYIGKV